LHKQSDYDGTGVGLSLVKRIIEDHGGKIWIESQKGAGATFFFTIQKDLGSNKKKYGLGVEEILHS
jgi:signal transduction histidine kinase